MENDMRKLIDQFKNFGKSPINEIFGLSKKEKYIKQLKIDIEQAKSEIDSVDMSGLFRETSERTDNDGYIFVANFVIANLKKNMPTFLKLFPEILSGVRNSGTNAASARYNYRDKILFGSTLSSLAPFMTPKYTDNIDEIESKENMKKRLDDLYIRSIEKGENF